MNGKLKCHHCEKEYYCEEILSNCKYSYPQMEALSLICPVCKKASQIRVRGCTLQAVEVVSALGPEWVVHDSLRPSGFEYRVDPEWVHCWYQGKHYEYQAK